MLSIENSEVAWDFLIHSQSKERKKFLLISIFDRYYTHIFTIIGKRPGVKWWGEVEKNISTLSYNLLLKQHTTYFDSIINLFEVDKSFRTQSVSIAAMLFIIEQWLSCIDTIKRLLIQPFFLSHSHSRRCRTLLFQMKKKTVFIAPWADHTLSSVEWVRAPYSRKKSYVVEFVCLITIDIWQCRTATVCWLIDCALCQLRTIDFLTENFFTSSWLLFLVDW